MRVHALGNGKNIGAHPALSFEALCSSISLHRSFYPLQRLKTLNPIVATARNRPDANAAQSPNCRTIDLVKPAVSRDASCQAAGTLADFE
jgi:hypothetical protein